MPEYMAVRKHHSLLDICRTPEIAAEVTITAAERLGVDAAIIFADLLLPLTPMGLDFEFVNGEGPVVHSPIRSLEQIQALRTDRAEELRYVSESIAKVAKHFNTRTSLESANNIPPADNRSLAGTAEGPLKGTGFGAVEIPLKGTGFGTAEIPLKGTGFGTAEVPLKGTGFSPSDKPAKEKGALAPEGMPANQDTLGIIGFLGAPFTLASYMIEGSGSRNYIEAKKLMYSTSGAWQLLMEKLVTLLVEYARQQVEAGADVIQVFDSWAGALSVEDYREFCLAPTTELIRRIQAFGVPVIYFGVDTASLLPTFRETGADVIGLDWRTPLAEARRTLGPGFAVQGNLDPITLFAPPELIEKRVAEILRANNNQPGHIFNLGHGIVPNTPVEAVIQVAKQLKNS